MHALILTLAFSASVELNKTILVPAPVTDVINWAAENQRAITTAMLYQVLQEDGDTLRVRRHSPKGDWEVTVRIHTPTTETPRGTEASLDVELLEVHKGSLKSQVFVVKLLPQPGDTTRLEIHAAADVPSLGRIALLGGLDASLKGFTRLVEKRWPK